MLLGKFVRIFNSLIDIENHIEEFFSEEPERFCKDGTSKSRERWRKVVGNKIPSIQFNKCITWNRNVNRKELSERLFESFESYQKYSGYGPQSIKKDRIL